MPHPTLTIVIPAWNEAATIRRCLEAAVAQTQPAEEIIVVDNLSTDATAAIVAEVAAEHPGAGIRLLRQDAEQGIVPTRNAGFDAATGTIIGRFDADSVIAPDWAEQVRAAFADESIAGISGPVEYYDMPLRSFGLRADNQLRRLFAKLAGDYLFLFGSNMAITAAAWRRIRDETCPDHNDLLHEDIDLAVHLALAGLRVAYVPAMVAGISARRLDSDPKDYLFYVERFERTYAAHGIRDRKLLAPMVVLLSIYPALHVQRRLQRRLETSRRRRRAIAELAGD